MVKDYSVPILNGSGDTDYARYMRTDELLSLQRKPEEIIHRDELLFQVVHQSSELWLKHACFEVEEATRQVQLGALDTAARLLGRASLGIELITGQLEMLRHLAPWDFQTLRTILGHGSGFESPGWHAVQRVSHALSRAFNKLIIQECVDLAELYRGSPDRPLYRLAEAMIDWDERVAIWRVRHYKIATRILGHEVIGTKGLPLEILNSRLSQKFFPELWRIRTVLSETGPMAHLCPLDEPSIPAENEEAGGAL
ncbi:tryptophan 2,3-dioxygenase [Ktedonosporobacter rubrisoli]|uniref:Tryptophan 2,3-dioxygenase n=1 Tax=Ktedonosporobacter rubrisoli TaxID=2509675 RepID=A0A4V0YYQ6_KTERU|nr:tryptophan 2,3-dioxygenase family protein [Ktedonosporobacter rubrisoli]QBD77051.1 tryptophan 2,3-dioxygenase [Ktedonosporobacter rubrisoli]